MKAGDSEHQEVGAIERLAADWALRQARGLSADEIKELGEWLASDDRHEQVFREMEATSRMLDGIKFRLAHETADPPTVVRSPVRRRRRWLQIAVGVAAALVVAAAAWQFTASDRRDYAGTAITAIGETRQLELPDGSTILLNTNTAVEVSFDREERHVRLLSGQAFFQVAKDPERPFVVRAGRVAIRAVGTAFDVRLRTDALNVLVAEGKVSVSNAEPRAPRRVASVDPGPVLGVGHMVRVPLDADQAPSAEGMMVTIAEPRAIRSVLAWQQGRLEFFDAPLAEVVGEFNRYNRHKIVIVDPELASRRFGGAFTSPDIRPLVELLEQSFGVTAEYRENETILRQAK